MKPVHFVIDEAGSVGQMGSIDDAVDKYRGYGVRLQFYYQSMAQLKRCFPEGQDQTLLSNVSATFFAINENETAKYVADRLGDATIIVNSGGTSTGTSHQRGEQGQRSTSYSENHSDNWQQIGRRLYRAEELMALNERIAISFMPGVPPIRTRLIRYYERDFRPGRLGRAISGLRMLATSAVILFVAAIIVASIVGAVASRNTYRQPDIVNDPLWGLDQRSFERR